MLDVDAQLARPGTKQVPLRAHYVADIQPLVERKILFAHRILANVDLQPLAVLRQMSKTRLAHVPDGGDSSCHPHLNPRLQLLGGLRAVLLQDLWDGVRKIEPLPVRSKPKRFDFLNPAEALLVQIVFKSQSSSLLYGNHRQQSPCHKYNGPQNPVL